MSDSSTMIMAVLLVVGLTLGAGVGYFMTPKEIDTNVSDYQSAYDEGYADGLKAKPTSGSSSSYDITEKLDEIINLLYGAIGASLVAALAAIVSLAQISKRLYS